jgi:protein phosphatase
MATDSRPTQNLQSPNSPLAQPESASIGLSLSQLAWKTGTNQGPRKDNQDCVLAAPPQSPNLAAKGVLLVVCDGVGGEDGGHIAANTAAHEAMRAYYEEPATDPLQAIQIAIDRAQLAVQAEATKTPRFGSMATTIVLVAIHNNYLHVGHVGDSRAYIFRGGQLAQLTRDHTFVNAQLESGSMTLEQAQRSIYKSTLVRSLGAKGNHTADYRTEVLQPGDRVLLCSDGLHGVVRDEQIATLLSLHPHPNNAVNHLIGAAVANQTGDNVSVALLSYGTPAPATQTSARAAAPTTQVARPSRPGWLVPLGVVLGLGAVALFAFGVLQNGRTVTPTPTVAATPAPAGGAVVSSATQPPTTAPVAATPTMPSAGATIESATPTPAATQAPQASATQPTAGEPTATLLPTPTQTPTPRPIPTRPPATRTSVAVVPTVDVSKPTAEAVQPTSPPPQPEQPTSPPPQPEQPTSPPQPPPTPNERD